MARIPFRVRRKKQKVCIIGLDCAAPELVFDRWRLQLPNLNRLMEEGVYGNLCSTIPAITVPAWSSMLTSKDPGTLGFYGFRNRKDYSYDQMSLANNTVVRERRVWQILGDAGYVSTVIGVPQTYPVRPLKGNLISGFLTPNQESLFTYPTALKKEILALEPDYRFDVKDFRTDDKEHLLSQIHDMTRSHFRVVDYMLKARPWDFFMSVEIGVDRMHHAFWHYSDPDHIEYEPGSRYEQVIPDYYRMIDRKIGEWIEMAGKDTVIMVVSDHGAKRMDGGVCINEWLWRNGYLAFKKEPRVGHVQKFEEMEVDWKNTKAWGSGGYYGRIFLNVKGREPQGVIPEKRYREEREELASRIMGIGDPQGRNIGTRVFKPDEIYQAVNNIAPDLIVYFGDLFWRSVGSLGYDGWHTFENDTGPDACNHAQNGLFIIRNPRSDTGNVRLADASILDIAPTVCALMGVRIPGDMQGRPIVC